MAKVANKYNHPNFHQLNMDQGQLLECIKFFNSIIVVVNDITTKEEGENGQKVVIAEYHHNGKVYKTRPLYYAEIKDSGDVKDVYVLYGYFNGKVYWLDIEKHNWPQPSGKSDLDHLVIDDMTEENDQEFKNFLKTLANNKQDGFIQRITQEGRPSQYYHNLENNNHWHDLILLIKEAIKNNGREVDKRFFQHLVYRWVKDNGDNGEKKRVSLAPLGYDHYKIISDLSQNIKSIQFLMDREKIKGLLLYKKQIILQGPPGTGKTKLAKDISRELTLPKSITANDIKRLIKPGNEVRSIADNKPYKIVTVAENSVTLELENRTRKPTSNDQIIQAYANYLNRIPLTGGDTYQAAIAKYIYDNWNDDDQIKIIQFHPSYSYEDFVRGIVAESIGDKIEYKNVNKILAKVAEEAKKSLDDSKKDPQNISRENKVREYLKAFAERITDQFDEGEMRISLTPKVSLIDVDDDAFRYNGKEWENAQGNRMLFNDLIQAYLDGNNTRIDIKRNNNLSGLARQHASYYVRVLNMFQEYLAANNLHFDNLIVEKPELKNYVLILDEINRANLSSVLGELIYALEYRNEEVTSMYEVDGSNTLVLPDNLYIIGTMNTADRSVGHIDYAIRRRFGFVDVMPKDLSGELGDRFHKELFNQVAAMFDYDKYLSREFKAKEVQLGHSYFIDKSVEGGSMHNRLEFEIKPILQEYVKDGILVGENITEVIDNLQA